MPHPGPATRTSASRRVHILSRLRSAVAYLDRCDDIDLSIWAIIVDDRDTAIRASKRDAERIRGIHAV